MFSRNCCFILFCLVLRVFWVRKMVYANMELLVEGRKMKTMQVPFIKAVLIWIHVQVLFVCSMKCDAKKLQLHILQNLFASLKCKYASSFFHCFHLRQAFENIGVSVIYTYSSMLLSSKYLMDAKIKGADAEIRIWYV